MAPVAGRSRARRGTERHGRWIVAASTTAGAAGAAGRLDGLDVDQLYRVAPDGMSAGLIPFWPYVLRVRVRVRVRVALVYVAADCASRPPARARVRIPDCAA